MLGMLVNVVVHPANVQDRDGADLLLTPALKQRLPRLEKVIGDGGYAGKCIDRVRQNMGVELEIIRRSAIDPATGAKQGGFKLLPKRWIVERTLGWAGRSRRLCRDHEATTTSERAWFQLALVHVMLGRLA